MVHGNVNETEYLGYSILQAEINHRDMYSFTMCTDERCTFPAVFILEAHRRVCESVSLLIIKKNFS